MCPVPSPLIHAPQCNKIGEQDKRIHSLDQALSCGMLKMCHITDHCEHVMQYVYTFLNCSYWNPKYQSVNKTPKCQHILLLESHNISSTHDSHNLGEDS